MASLIYMTLHQGFTYIHQAARLGQSNMFRVIFESEEAKNPKTSFNMTPFQYACQNCHLKVVEYIIKVGYLSFNRRMAT